MPAPSVRLALELGPADALARLDEIDALAVDLVWVPGEVEALHACAALSARTRAPGIVVAGFEAPFHHPLRVAEDLATLDGISAGRIECVVRPGSEAADRLAEELGVLRQAWSDEPVSHAGDFHEIDGVDVHPKPQRPGGPPLWLEVEGEAFARAAAALGTGAVVGSDADAHSYLEGWRASEGSSEPRLAFRLPEGEADAADLESARSLAERMAAALVGGSAAACVGIVRGNAGPAL